MDDIPVKLRCATCNKLANNAYRMPCCDQSICDACRCSSHTRNKYNLNIFTGQASLPEACPVCYHEPVKPEDCRPNKALRTTIKVFLRKKVVEHETAEKKRKAAEKSAAPSALPPSDEVLVRQASEKPVQDAQETSITAATEAKPTSCEVSEAPKSPAMSGRVLPTNMPTEAQKDIPQTSIEVRIFTRFYEVLPANIA